MSEELKEKLITEIELADWNMLNPHHEKSVVFIISEELDLADVGAVMALNDADKVKKWLDEGAIYRPKESQVTEFSKSEFEKICHFLIIQPFVLIKLIH